MDDSILSTSVPPNIPTPIFASRAVDPENMAAAIRIQRIMILLMPL
jgi:hypothetical protein